MTGENDEKNGDDFEEDAKSKEEIESEEDAELDDEDIVVTTHEDTVVDKSVESLVAKMDLTDAEEAARQRKVRRKLEEQHEQREKDLDSTFNFNIDDEL